MLKPRLGMLGSCAPWVSALFIACLSAPPACAQEKPSAPVPHIVAHNLSAKPQAAVSQHGFWDKENSWLFAGVAASRTLDYFSTLNMRRRGRQEILLSNDLVDNHAAFAAVEAAAVGASIGASYLFHRFHHHKLERWISIVHFGLATTGAVRNYCLVTAHPSASTASVP